MGKKWLMKPNDYEGDFNIHTPDGKKCNHKGKWTKNSLNQEQRFLWSMDKDKIKKPEPRSLKVFS